MTNEMSHCYLCQYPVRPILHFLLFFCLNTLLVHGVNIQNCRDELIIGSPKRCIELCDTFFREATDTQQVEEALFIKGEALVRDGQLDKALAEWGKLRGKMGNSFWKAKAFLRSGDVHLENRKNASRALTFYEEGLRSAASPEKESLLLGKARAQWEQRKADDARKTLSLLIQSNPPTSILELAQGLEKKWTVRGKQDQELPDKSLIAARNAWEQQDIAEVLRQAKIAISKANSRSSAYFEGLFLQACALCELDKTSEAQAVFKQISSNRNSEKWGDLAKIELAQLYLSELSNARIAERLLNEVNIGRLDSGSVKKMNTVRVLVLVELGRAKEAASLYAENAVSGEVKLEDVKKRIATGKILDGDDILGNSESRSYLIRYADRLFSLREWEKASKAYAKAERKERELDIKAYCKLMDARALALCYDYKKALEKYEDFEKGRVYFQSKWAGQALVRSTVLWFGPMNNYKMGIRTADMLIYDLRDDQEIERMFWYKILAAECKAKRYDGLLFCSQYLEKFPNGTIADVIKNKKLPLFKK